MNGNQTALRAVPRDSLARLQNRIGFEVVLVYYCNRVWAKPRRAPGNTVFAAGVKKQNLTAIHLQKGVKFSARQPIYQVYGPNGHYKMDVNPGAGRARLRPG